MRSKRQLIFFTVIFAALFFSTRVPGLGRDEINPDSVNWHWRSEQFVVALKAGNWQGTYQHYHPGVTLMWIVGPTVEVIKQLFPQEYGSYNHENFSVFHTASKMVLVFVQFVLSLIAIYLLSKLFSPVKAFLIVGLFTLEPFFVGNSRIIHLDLLMSLFILNGLSLAYWGIRDYKAWKVMLAGFFLSLAFLTKSVSAGAFLFAFSFGAIWLWFYEKRDIKKIARYLVLLSASFVVATFLLFPALWVKPAYVLTELWQEGARGGVRKGHGQIVMGEYTRDAGAGFYPLVLLMKTSLVTWVGVALFLYFSLKNYKSMKSLSSFPLYLTIFYLGYLLVMTFPTKKIDRYMIPMVPYFAILAVLGYSQVEKLSKKLVPLLFLVFITIPLISFFPHYFTYTSPLFGSVKRANTIIAQKPFGIAIPDLKQFIFERHGEYPKLGFLDVKPMKAIYMNSRVCDFRVCGSDDYDVLVIGINEELPNHLGERFAYDSSFFVNGLEYWKIYVKNDTL